MKARYGDNSTDVDEVRMDEKTRTLINIDTVHSEIHKGNHFFIAGHQDVGAGSSIDFTVVTTTGVKVHLLFEIEGTDAVSVEAYEDVTVDVQGTSATPQNNDRNSSNSSQVTVRVGDTFSDTGTKFSERYSGARKVTGFLDREEELILKENTTYLFRIKNESTSTNHISYYGKWYEVEDL